MTELIYVWPNGRHCTREALQDNVANGWGNDYDAVTEEEFLRDCHKPLRRSVLDEHNEQ